MGHGEHEQDQTPDPNVGVLAHETRVLHFSGRGVGDLSFGQELTGLGWRLTVHDVLALCRPFADGLKPEVSAVIDICSSRRVGGLTTVPSVATMLAAADMVRPTRAQIVAAFEVAHVWAADDNGYVFNRMLSMLTLDRWHELATADPAVRMAYPEHLPGREPALERLLGAAQTQPDAERVARAAARNGWSAAVDLKRTYLSNDCEVSYEARIDAVTRFARSWLGWKGRIPEEKTQALIDALLSDDWPSTLSSPPSGDDDLRNLVRRLVREPHLNWRPFHKGQINKQSIISHSIQVQAPSGESIELIDLMAGPDLGAVSHVPMVRSVLAELDPVEQEVWRTYADCPGRRSWRKAARLNGLPEAFGEDRVRRKILRRFVSYPAAATAGHQAKGR